MVGWLGDEYDFRVVTRDRDLGETRPYPGSPADSWTPIGRAEVCYLSPRNLSMRRLRTLLRATEYDAVYLNSFFSPAFTIKPLLLRRLGLVPRVPYILAPRGEFFPGALMLKGSKKRIYLDSVRALKLYRGITWQASSRYEEEYIRQWFGGRVPVIIAPNLPSVVRETEKDPSRREKVAGRLKVVFLSRISRNKNLIGALTMLEGLRGEVHMNIYGPLEDRRYWERCRKHIDSLPRNVQVRYCGSVAHERVAGIMADHDLLLLPTQGENFGHVILEALLAGCPALISDRTPWRGLRDRGVGWDLPLEQPESFRAALQSFVEMDSRDHRTWSRRARAFGLERVQDHTVVNQHRKLFDCALTERKFDRSMRASDG
jgi:glycosyltransferase involved in cell wall biosynthesis